jgi:hypothetical protein
VPTHTQWQLHYQYKKTPEESLPRPYQWAQMANLTSHRPLGGCSHLRVAPFGEPLSEPGENSNWYVGDFMICVSDENGSRICLLLAERVDLIARSRGNFL